MNEIFHHSTAGLNLRFSVPRLVAIPIKEFRLLLFIHSLVDGRNDGFFSFSKVITSSSTYIVHSEFEPVFQ